MMNQTEMNVRLTRLEVNDLMLATVFATQVSTGDHQKWLRLHGVLCDQLKEAEKKITGVYTYKVEYFSNEKQETRQETIEVNSYMFPEDVKDRDAMVMWTALNRAMESRESGEAVTGITLMSIE